MKRKCPPLSVCNETVCEGLDAVTFAFATGAPESVSVTVPLNPPVVPASAHVPWTRNVTDKISATNIRLTFRDIDVAPYVEETMQFEIAPLTHLTTKRSET